MAKTDTAAGAPAPAKSASGAAPTGTTRSAARAGRAANRRPARARRSAPRARAAAGTAMPLARARQLAEREARALRGLLGTGATAVRAGSEPLLGRAQPLRAGVGGAVRGVEHLVQNGASAGVRLVGDVRRRLVRGR